MLNQYITTIFIMFFLLSGCNDTSTDSSTALPSLSKDEKMSTSQPSCMMIQDLTEDNNDSNFNININFQPVSSDLVQDYFPDNGLPFGDRGNQMHYGWSNDVSKWARDRNSAIAKDQRYDTLMHMKHHSLPINSMWEIELPNDNYNVRIVSGDLNVGYCGNDYKIAIEGILSVNETPNCPKFIDKTTSVVINDKRLTIEPLPESIDAKISFIEITKNNNKPDITPPSSVTNANKTEMNSKVFLNWNNPLYDFSGTLILYDEKPINYHPTDGVECFSSELAGTLKLQKLNQDSSTLINELENTKGYFIKIFTFDDELNYSSPVSMEATPNIEPFNIKKENSEYTMENLLPTSSPVTIDSVFEEFATTHFGAKSVIEDNNTPEQIKSYFKKELKVLSEPNNKSKWQHISRYSAAFGWSTNLPTKSFIDYHIEGDATSILTSTQSSRYHYNHLHHLKSLLPDTTYKYSINSIDEYGKITKGNGDFTTGLTGEVIEIPGNMGPPPYQLSRTGVTYLLTQDITSKSGTIEITALGQGDILLDMGGNTVNFANELHNDYDRNNIHKNGMGIFRSTDWSKGKLTIVNGSLLQSEIKNIPTETSGFNAIFLQKQIDLEIAGIKIDYQTPQTMGIYLWSLRGNANIHHNEFNDRGSIITNRHGTSGGRSIYFRESQTDNNHKIHHNLVKRTRQNGLSFARYIDHNEIYVDSWSTNAFAIQPANNNAQVTNNKIFLTGYHAIGISWASTNMNVQNNLIHMEGINTHTNRWFEAFGDQNSLNGLRLTNYGAGGQVRQNLRYENNVIIGTARNGSMMRGIEIFSDYSAFNTQVNNSRVAIYTEDNSSMEVSPIVTQGTQNTKSLPVYYKNTQLSSNLTNIRFGDSYGRGYNHHFYNSIFDKQGDNNNYHTFIFDGGYSTDGHVIRDAQYRNNAAFDDVYWKRTGDLSAYSVEWTLTITGKKGEKVTIVDINNNEVFKGVIGENERILVPLTEMIIRPTEWHENSRGTQVIDKYSHQKIMHTPHKIYTKNNSQVQSINMNKIQKIELY